MPYIVTTSTPATHEPTEDGQLGNITAGKSTRRAVATLDEARRLAAEPIYASRSVVRAAGGKWTPIQDVNADLPEDGGSVGPLPDGTTIKVERAAPCHDARRAILIGNPCRSIELPVHAQLTTDPDEGTINALCSLGYVIYREVCRRCEGSGKLGNSQIDCRGCAGRGMPAHLLAERAPSGVAT